MKKGIMITLVTLFAVGLIFHIYLNTQDSSSEIRVEQYSDITLVLINNYQPDTLIPLQTKLQNSFPGVEVTITERNLMLPEELLNEERQQYDSVDVLSYIDQSFQNRLPMEIIIGITEDEIYSGNLNFAFSSGDRVKKVGIVSTAYFGREIQMPENRGGDFDFMTYLEGVLNERAHKTALRVIGGMVGLEPNLLDGSDCAMNFSSTLSELDKKGTNWCGNNRELLQTAGLLVN